MKNRVWKRKTNIIDTLEIPERKKQHVLTILLSILALIALLHFIAVTHSAYPTIIASTCDQAIRNANYTQYISLTKSQQMSAVQFTDDLTAGRPSAMVQVTDTSAQHLLDIYIYSCSIQHRTPTITLLLKQQELVQGTATITQVHTLSIGQLDATLATNKDSFLLPLQRNVYHEYAWKDGALRQTSFPGLYPVLSRSEGEALQEQANYNQDMPWGDPQATAEQMAQDLLKWPAKSFHSTIVATNDSEAHIRLTQPALHMEVMVSLAKLVQHDANGLWFVTTAQTAGITLRQIQRGTPYSSPISIQGTILEQNDHIATTIFDHTLASLNNLNNPAPQIQKNGIFTGNISYSNPFPNQPGLLLIEALPPPLARYQKNMKHKEALQVAEQPAGQLLLTNTILA